MNRKRFFEIIKDLRISSINNPRDHKADYTPMLKVSEVKEVLELRFQTLYKLGRNLSVDEALLRAYDRILFKIRVVVKSVQYGIKIYVVTDSTDEYVLHTSVYTGGDKSDVTNKDATLKKTT